MTATHLTARLRSARIMARTTDSPATKLYWLERAAELSRELGLVVSPFEGFATVRPVRAAWFDRWENL
jgi:hypothetical protein